MSLATRCPACGTVFRVVQDQLKVSGGWVRCGQCHEVFNGLQTLFELPTDPPATAPAPSSPTAAPTSGLFVSRDAPPPPPETWEPTEPVALDEGPEAEAPTVDLADQPAQPEPEPLIDSDAAPAPMHPPRVWAYMPQLADDDTSEAETVMPATDEDDDALVMPEAVTVDEPASPEPAHEPAAAAPPPAPAPEAPPPVQSFVISQPPALPSAWQGGTPSQIESAPAELEHAEPTPAPAGPDPFAAPPLEAHPPGQEAQPADAPRRRRSKRQRKPAFMRQAERAARWRTPAVRAVLGGTSAILGAMLALQVAHHLRDDLAARWPAARSALTAWCQLASCQLKAPRALSSITLDSSALSKTARPQVLRFEAELRNSAGHAVMAPALDVSFTDNLGHQLARKVLLPEQLGASAAGLPPNQTWHIEVPLQVGDLQIAGFTAEVFYP